MDLISSLPRTDIYYVGVGTAEGSFVENSKELNQQFPQFLDKYCMLSKTFILIDPRLNTPTHAEKRVVAMGAHIIATGEGYVVYDYDGTINNIITIRSDELVRLDPENRGYTKDALDFVASVVSFVLAEDAMLFYHDFTGHSLVPFYQIYDPMGFHNKIMFSITTRAEDGCFTKMSALSDIEIDSTTMTIRNPWSHNITELLTVYDTATSSYKVQIAQRLYSELMNLRQLAYDIDFSYRKDPDDGRPMYIRSAIIPADVREEILTLYDNTDTREVAKSNLYRIFKDRFGLLKSLISADIALPDIYDPKGSRASSYCAALLEVFRTKVDFTLCRFH